MRRKIIIATLLLIMVILWFIKSFMSSDLYFQGIDYVQTVTQVQELRRENMQLYNELLLKESLIQINKEARKAGFIEAKYLYY